MIGDEVCKEKANENENYRIDKAGVGDKCWLGGEKVEVEACMQLLVQLIINPE
jgi:hypothetical protein